MKLINTTRTHQELVQNQLDNELEVIREFFLKRKIDKDIVLMDKLRTVHTDKLIEISFPTTV